MDKRTVASAHERSDDLQIQVAEIKTEVKIQFREVFARVKRFEAIMIGASASIIAMLVMVLTRMP
jgi:hypothetical protein